MSQDSKAALAAILQRLAASRADEEAWALLFDLLWGRVFATTFRVLKGHRERAEDASQETFIRLLKYADFRKLSDSAEFQRYVHTVAENVAYGYLREMRQLASHLELQSDALAGDSPEELAQISEAIQQLSDELTVEEHALARLIVEGSSVSEIAQRLGWSYSNAGVRVHRLRQMLRKLLKERGFL
jgi:RNA polymerase sigma factor (sigma-70 family)